MNEEMFDLHEGKMFTVRDFKVIRWHGANIIASPYHAKVGGCWWTGCLPMPRNCI